MKHLKSILFLMVIALLMLSACGGGSAATSAPEQPGSAATDAPATEVPAEKKVVTFSWTQEFTTLSPLYSSGWFTGVTQQFWNCWAWNFDENNTAYPYLVTEMPTFENGGISEDGLTITLHLRDDIKWSDNEPITSEDFRFSWAMNIDPKNTVNSTYPEDQVTSIDTPDAQTVVLHFDAPVAAWQNLFTGIVPAHILQAVYDAEGTLDNAEWNNNPTVGCGPYNFAEWESGSYARFVKNENYFDAPAKIDEIFIRFVPDDTAQTAALIAGDADLGTFIPYSEVPKLKEAGVVLMTESSGYNEGLFVQVSEKYSNPAMLDVNL